MKPICIIPARSGSVRIKNKNIQKIDGHHLISITIKKLIKTNLFKRIIVTTDSETISKIAIKSGAEVPFLRAKKLSKNEISINEVLHDAILKSKTENEMYHACVFATAIFAKKKNFLSAIEKIKYQKYENVIAIKKYENHPFKSLFILNDKIYPNFKKKLLNTQDYTELYHDAGYFYFFKTKNFLKTKKLLTNNTSYEVLKKNESVDIDTKEDLDLAKHIYKHNLLKK